MKFVPEMFGDDGRGTTRWGLQGSDKQIACELAQTAFDKWLAEQPRVWGCEDRDFGVMVYFDDEDTATHNTHTARLVAIKEIEK